MALNFGAANGFLCLHGPSSRKVLAPTSRAKCLGDSAAQVFEAAWEILDDFNRNDIRRAPQTSFQTPQGVAALSASVLYAAQVEESKPLISICADNKEQAVKALQHWISALGYQVRESIPSSLYELGSCLLQAPSGLRETISGPVYLKYNAASGVLGLLKLFVVT